MERRNKVQTTYRSHSRRVQGRNKIQTSDNPKSRNARKRKTKYTAKEERRLKEEFDKAQQQAQKTKAYEKMLKEKKSTLKPIKKPQEDSSSEEQRVRQKKIEDSSSSEIPKRRNMKPRCLMIRLRSAREVAEEGERPVLTERREDTPMATPELTTELKN